MQYLSFFFNRKRSKKTCFVFCAIGFFLMIFSISCAKAVIGDGLLVYLFDISNSTGFVLFLSDLFLAAISFLLALYYMPKEKDFVGAFDGRKISSDYFARFF